MDQKNYDSYPNQIQVRELKVASNVYVTTFLNNKKYHKKELTKIYERRWECENGSHSSMYNDQEKYFSDILEFIKQLG